MTKEEARQMLREIRDAAVDVLADHIAHGGGHHMVLLVASPWGKSKRKRLGGQGSPLGEPVWEDEHGTWVRFDAWDVKDWSEQMLRGLGR